jgi:hypothetical protein
LQEAQNVLHYHQYDLVQALVELFPEIGLEKSMFPSKANLNGMFPLIFAFPLFDSFSLLVSLN